ncbi:unnamed protein product [Microthlaspi erraticum]|uniref:Uncharacterized protein n=1 Tax=Microthlaspi erraticum TaxID=1685480 RepID=A0A6D2KZ39_9BRAS|nr:unnamed protein product [Microthlaspi erraticum]
MRLSIASETVRLRRHGKPLRVLETQSCSKSSLSSSPSDLKTHPQIPIVAVSNISASPSIPLIFFVISRRRFYRIDGKSSARLLEKIISGLYFGAFVEHSTSEMLEFDFLLLSLWNIFRLCC